jgi:hypothetical protein
MQCIWIFVHRAAIKEAKTPSTIIIPETLIGRYITQDTNLFQQSREAFLILAVLSQLVTLH